MNKFLIVAIGLLLLMALVDFLPLPAISSGGAYAIILIAIAEIMGMIMMLVNGTFTDTRYYTIAKGAIALVLLGAAFKILHYPGADQLLIIPFAILCVLYIIHFFGKKAKNHLDVLKLFTVFGFFIPAPLFVVHLISEETIDVLITISHIIFWITFVDFLVLGFARRTLFKS